MTPWIVVGIDAQPGSCDAAAWAGEECRVRAAPLLVLHATGVGTDLAAEYGLWSTRTEQLEADWPDIEVEARLSCRSARDALVEISPEAELIVVGSNGAADVSASILGGVAHTVAVHAECPVVVVPAGYRPDTTNDDGRIVVGAAPTAAGRNALRFALDEASRRPSALTIVSARADAGEVVDDLDALRGATTVDVRHVTGDPVEALLDAARGSQLLVLGSHHSADRINARLGSVPTAVLPRASCPVALVGRLGVPG